MNDTYDDRPDETRLQLAWALARDSFELLVLFMLAVSMTGWRFLRRQ